MNCRKTGPAGQSTMPSTRNPHRQDQPPITRSTTQHDGASGRKDGGATPRCEQRPRRDGGAGVVRPALDARLEGESGVRPNLSIPFRSPGLAERVPFGNGSHFWVMLPEAAGIMGRMELAATWWAFVQGLGVTSGERDPAGMVRALVGDDIPIEVLATDKWNCRMLLADHVQI